LQNIGIGNIINKGQENVRESQNIGAIGDKAGTHKSVGMRNVMSNRLEGEEVIDKNLNKESDERVSTYKSQ
jgi:hypothetical protein